MGQDLLAKITPADARRQSVFCGFPGFFAFLPNIDAPAAVCLLRASGQKTIAPVPFFCRT
jgi:hypothetical protein